MKRNALGLIFISLGIIIIAIMIITLIPKKTKEITITFIVDGGTTVKAITMESGDPLTLPTTTKEGYTFEGWTLDGKLVEDNTIFKENATLKAKWKSKTNTNPTTAKKNNLVLEGRIAIDAAMQKIQADALTGIETKTCYTLKELGIDNDGKYTGYVTIKNLEFAVTIYDGTFKIVNANSAQINSKSYDSINNPGGISEDNRKNKTSTITCP